jgi:hypothetical protein
MLIQSHADDGATPGLIAEVIAVTFDQIFTRTTKHCAGPLNDAASFSEITHSSF